MKFTNLFNFGLATALLSASMLCISCGEEDDPAPINKEEQPEVEEEVVLVSEIKCTVEELPGKIKTLKTDEKVTVTVTNVTNKNINRIPVIFKYYPDVTDKFSLSLIIESDEVFDEISMENFSMLSEITIPEKVKEIKKGDFDGCINLKSVHLLGWKTIIEDNAFAENVIVDQPNPVLLSPEDIVAYVLRSNEDTVTLNLPLEAYDHTAVMMAIDKIKSDKKVKLVIPEGVTEFSINEDVLGIEDDPDPFRPPYQPTFPQLVSVEIPEGVSSIGDYAFFKCYNLTSIKIPESVTEIGVNAFSHCRSLTGIKIPHGVTELKRGFFLSWNSLESISIPEGVTTIGLSAFAYCENLKSVTLPKSVTKIESLAFFLCEKLTDITLSEGITEIGEHAFSYCTGLTSITIPNSVTKISSSTFFDCYSLKTIYCSQAIYDKYHYWYPEMVVKK